MALFPNLQQGMAAAPVQTGQAPGQTAGQPEVGGAKAAEVPQAQSDLSNVPLTGQAMPNV
jgi:hypothetical protein